MADPARRARGLTTTLVGAGASLLAVGQSWSVQQRVDPAGVAVRESWTGQDLAPEVAALVLLVVVTSLVGVVWRGAAGLLARAAAVVTALVATVMVLGVRPDAPTAWWWITLGGSGLTALGTLLALRARSTGATGRGPLPATPPEPPRDPGAETSDPHERARRSQETTWSALSAGEDPTVAPRPVQGPGAGTMSDEGQVDPSGR